MFNHQLRLQAKRYLDPDFRVVLSQKFKALSLTADAATLQNARRLTLAAREFFGGSSGMGEIRLPHQGNEKVNEALRACFLALKAWAKAIPALTGGPDELEARLAMAELYSKGGKLFFYGFMHDAKLQAIDFADLHIDAKKNAFDWLALRHSCHKYAIHHMLLARGCECQNGLQMLSDQPLDCRTMWAYENGHNSARDLLRYGEGLLGEKDKSDVQGENISYKLEMHVYESMVRQRKQG